MTRETKQIIVGVVFAAAVIIGFIISRQFATVDYDSGYHPTMGTFARIVVVSNDKSLAKICAEKALKQIRLVDTLMSDYKKTSDIGHVNRSAFKNPVPVNDSTFEVLQKSITYSKLTDGAFDVTVGPLVDLWKASGKTGTAPKAEELKRAKAKVGFEKLILDEQKKTVQFKVDGMRIDLGGIAKGYAIDRTVELMQQFDILGGMVEIGGEIKVFGKPTRGKAFWLLGIQDPAKASPLTSPAESLIILKLKQNSLATSGDYQQFVLIDDKKFSHIIDTQKARGLENSSSVTIIAKNCTDADALATAVSVMGTEKGLTLIETIPDTEAIIITPNKETKIIKTSGADKYIK